LSTTTTVDELAAVVPVVNPKSIALTVTSAPPDAFTIGKPGANTGTPAAVPACAVTNANATPAVVDGACVAAIEVVELAEGMQSTNAKYGLLNQPLIAPGESESLFAGENRGSVTMSP